MEKGTFRFVNQEYPDLVLTATDHGIGAVIGAIPNGSPNQLWEIRCPYPDTDTDTVDSESAPPPPGACILVNKGTKQLIGPPHGVHVENGTPVIVGPKTGWTFERGRDPRFVRLVLTGTHFNAQLSDGKPGMPVVLWERKEQANWQIWEMFPVLE